MPRYFKTLKLGPILSRSLSDVTQFYHQRKLVIGVSSNVTDLIDKCSDRLSEFSHLSNLHQSGKLEFISLGNEGVPSSAVATATATGAAATKGADILLCDPALGAGIIDKETGRNVKWMQSTFAGVNALLRNSKRRDYVLTRIGRGFGPQMAEYCLGYILQHQLQLQLMDKSQQQKIWDHDRLILSKGMLIGNTIGILGTGNIGEAIAAAASKAFHMRTIGFSRTSKSRASGSFSQRTTDMQYLLRESDVIINTLPSTSLTTGLLTLDLLANCKDRCPLFINVGRGDIISEGTIVSAIDRSFISRAVLDVFDVEPLPRDSALWAHPQVTVTPHISAISTPDIVVDVFVDNLNKYVQGEPLEHIVDMDNGY